MRPLCVALMLFWAHVAFPQAIAEGALVHSSGAGASTAAGRSLGTALDQAFSRATPRAGSSKIIEVPPARRVPSRSGTAQQRSRATTTMAHKQGNAATPTKPSSATPPRKKSWEISTARPKDPQ